MIKQKKADRILLSIVFILITVGFFIFASASLGEAGRGGSSFNSLVFKQLAILLGGIVLMSLTSKFPYKNWRPYAIALFGLSLLLTAIVFVPQIGLSAGGARRWLNLGFTTFQPSEFLKLSMVIYLAAWATARKEKIKSWQHGLLPFLGFLGLASALLYKQPDIGTLLVICSSSIAVFILAGGQWKHLALIIMIGFLAIGTFAYFKPYARDRVITFLSPASDKLGKGYQIDQSLIAIGAGGITGRGFGQSMQKFNFLPEPIGDSIFAIASEEFGFAGSVIIILLFLVFALWGLKVMTQVADPFGRTLGASLVIMITAQAFINIGAMLGVLPLTGVPLVFISHGGTALLFALIEVGIILNISRYKS
ncbi:MAG: putative peptidoglycan glycosyltransferase FtsW [Candidatus Vogelbacteria bacterium]|nr:putative peptidoglycan glycosyltransferase FtsW [Candidatus Vogelbacteria bacterium]